MLAKVYSNALMTSLNSRGVTDRRPDLEPGGAVSQQYSQYSSYSDRPGRRTMERQDPLKSFASNGGVVTNGPPTVVHISTDREVAFNYEDDDVKNVVSYNPDARVSTSVTDFIVTGAGPHRRIPHVTDVK